MQVRINSWAPNLEADVMPASMLLLLWTAKVGAKEVPELVVSNVMRCIRDAYVVVKAVSNVDMTQCRRSLQARPL